MDTDVRMMSTDELLDLVEQKIEAEYNKYMQEVNRWTKEEILANVQEIANFKAAKWFFDAMLNSPSYRDNTDALRMLAMVDNVLYLYAESITSRYDDDVVYDRFEDALQAVDDQYTKILKAVFDYESILTSEECKVENHIIRWNFYLPNNYVPVPDVPRRANNETYTDFAKRLVFEFADYDQTEYAKNLAGNGIKEQTADKWANRIKDKLDESVSVIEDLLV